MNSAEVCRRAGVSYRQLDHWIKMGYLTPAVDAKGSGHPRTYSTEDAIVATVLKDYLACRQSGRPLGPGFQNFIRTAIREKPKVRLGRRGSVVSLVIDLDAARSKVVMAGWLGPGQT